MNTLEDVLQGLWLDGLSDGGTGNSQLDDVSKAKQAIIDWAIEMVGGDYKTSEYVNRMWWRAVGADEEEYCNKSEALVLNESFQELRNKFKEEL
jgi:hypothetical protein